MGGACLIAEADWWFWMDALWKWSRTLVTILLKGVRIMGGYYAISIRKPEKLQSIFLHYVGQTVTVKTTPSSK